MSAEILYTASVIRTMDSSMPIAEAVVVLDGHIVAVGAIDDLTSRFPDAVRDDRFADNVLLPGFVEAHAHRLEGGVWGFPYVGYFPRSDPDGRRWDGCRSIDEVVARLREIERSMIDADEPLIAWGLDPIYFAGDRLVASHLDRVSSSRPIFIMHANLHIATVNSELMRSCGIDRTIDIEGLPKDANGDPVGELQELVGMSLAGNILMRLFASSGSPEATRRFGQLACNAGITTVTDLGSTGLGSDGPVDDYDAVVNDPTFPARISVFFNPAFAGGNIERCVDRIAELRACSTEKLRFGHVKIVIDGSIQGFTARLLPPGYFGDQPNGIWLVAPEQVMSQVRAFHDAGLMIHAHCNGDEAAEVFLDAVEAALAANPRSDHRHTVQHCQLTTGDQYLRMRQLGLCANLFANHTYYWGDQHAALTVGPNRAATMNAARTALDVGVPMSMHCDAAVTPLGSLHVAWCAVNRVTATGVVLGPDERISVAEALHAITIGAAYQLHMDHEIGSITEGKRADFAVLESDPLEVDPMSLKDIAVWGTVVGGVPFQAQ